MLTRNVFISCVCVYIFILRGLRKGHSIALFFNFKEEKKVGKKV